MRIRTDVGFTLIELMISTTVMGIIVVAATAAVSTIFLNSASTAVRMSQSHDAQNLAAYFSEDAQSVGVRDWNDNTRPVQQSIEENVAYNGGLAGRDCGTASTPKAVVRMAWDDFDPANVDQVKIDVAAYVPETTGPNGSLQLHRLQCQTVLTISTGAVVPGTSKLSDGVVVQSLGPGSAVACSPSPCTSTNVPATIALTVTIHDVQNRYPDYTVTLPGHPRQT